ncbi:zona pellucida sperm-binding protein 3-like [Aulostomus maculatus]
MVMKCTALCLVALALLGSLCDAQWPGYTSDPNIQKPRPPPRQESKNPFPDNQQSKQTFQKPLTWEYPEDPKPDPKPEGPFELRHPVPAATVSVECRERDAKVAVKKDMFGIGQFISGSDLTLGRCAVAADDVANQEFILMAELHDCDSSVMMTEDFIIYSFTVNYDPRPVGTAPVVRTSKAAVIVECHYPRKHNVSSLPLDPHWIPFSAVKVAEEFLYFTLKLMTDDWKFERPSYQYYLGDMIRIEAAVKQYYHVPLRVYVTHCTATLAPDVNSNPKYMFIQNHGCLIDARVTGSDSRFMARSEENKLQFQLEAFRFHEVDSGMIYITCHLKATSTACPIDAEHRACSFISGWKEASGIDPACDSFVEWEGDVTLGPIPIMEAAA